MYEFLSWEIDKTKLDEAISEYKPQTTVENRNYSEYKKVEEFVPKTNPEEFCVFNSSSPRDRCVFVIAYRNMWNESNVWGLKTQKKQKKLRNPSLFLGENENKRCWFSEWNNYPLEYKNIA